MSRVVQIFLDESGNGEFVVHLEQFACIGGRLLQILLCNRLDVAEIVFRLEALELALYASEFILNDGQAIGDEGTCISGCLVLVEKPNLIVHINQRREYVLCAGRELVLVAEHQNGGFLAGNISGQIGCQ